MDAGGEGAGTEGTDESVVLLKNEAAGGGKKLLPLDAGKLKSIAVVGPYANEVLIDWYSGTPPFAVTPLEGIRTRVGSGVTVTYAKGDDLAAVTALAKACGCGGGGDREPSDVRGGMECLPDGERWEGGDRPEEHGVGAGVDCEGGTGGKPEDGGVLQASFPFTTTWSQEHAPAILEITHNSEEQGDGLADVLFGDYDPAGRLTQTWVRDEADLPPMMDYNLRDGRTYMYARQKPLYAFGFGLSYNELCVFEAAVSAPVLREGEVAAVSVEVKNTGSRSGDEVVQMYVSHEGSSVVRPMEELKGFARVSLRAGETKTVTLPLSAKALSYWDEKAKAFVVEKDRVVVKVGGNSDDLPVKAVVSVM